jgi:mannose/fructose-specific phosphotransferase system component IIA
LAFFPVVACHPWVLEELHTSAEMLAPKSSQAKLAGVFPEARKNR